MTQALHGRAGGADAKGGVAGESASDPLMRPEGLWKESPFEDPVAPRIGPPHVDAGAPGDPLPAWLVEAGLLPQGGKGPGIGMLFYFVTCWIFFVQGIASMSDLAVSYFYKDTLKVDPATLSTVTSLTALPWTIKPIYGFLSDGEWFRA